MCSKALAQCFREWKKNSRQERMELMASSVL